MLHIYNTHYFLLQKASTLLAKT